MIRSFTLHNAVSTPSVTFSMFLTPDGLDDYPVCDWLSLAKLQDSQFLKQEALIKYIYIFFTLS